MIAGDGALDTAVAGAGGTGISSELEVAIRDLKIGRSFGCGLALTVDRIIDALKLRM